jgi:hypothetical protein
MAARFVESHPSQSARRMGHPAVGNSLLDSLALTQQEPERQFLQERIRGLRPPST